MISEPPQTHVTQAKKRRSDRRFAIFWLVLGIVEIILGAVGISLHREPPILGRYSYLFFGLVWLGYAFVYWRRGRLGPA
ncbi:MAG TPA: hypothetical protein VNF68_05495 [Candidatus Baltobacteraceae bacterium]|nr:hypothetical protein [Candidatus Baltobacteraceae bacterium]